MDAPDFSFLRQPSNDPLPPAPARSEHSDMRMWPSSGSMTSSANDPLAGLHAEPEGPSLDPRRNDDLPPRPTTSRGRPGSAQYGDMDPVHITERYPGPPPGVQDMDNGAQVLDITAFQQYSDDDDNDFGRGPSTSHLHGHGAHHGTHHPSGGAAAKGGAASKQRPGSGDSGSGLPATRTASASAQQPLDEASQEFISWRSRAEASLSELGASISGQDAVPELLPHATKLAGLVEEARKHEHSSRWLNGHSVIYRDGGGASLTMREAILEHVFRLMDSSSTELLMKACSMVLRVVKSRQPLLQTAKLLYRLSKDSTHDTLFRREALLEPLIHTVHIMVASAKNSSSPYSLHEPLIYMNGCLKNISHDTSNQRALIKLGALYVLAALLNQLAGQAEADPQPATLESCGQVAVQVSGVLRNLAVSAQSAPVFASTGTIQALRAATGALWQQPEVVLNFGRILSKLSLHDGCQAAIEADAEYAPLLVKLLTRYSENRAILLRVAFVMGNLTTYSNEYRRQVAQVPGSLATVVSTLQAYAMQDASAEEGGDKIARAASREDCLVKVLRLTANLAIHPDVGPQLACQQVVADALLRLLQEYSFDAADELVLNTVCALTNLSFYQSDASFTNAVLLIQPSQLMPRVTPLLLVDNEEAVIEAARVYGNFSRSPDVRAYMHASRVVDALVLLLDHGNAEVLYSICGTLINFTMDPARKDALVGLGGVSRLVDVLGRTLAQEELNDMEVGVVEVVCKALFNIAADDNNASEAAASVASGAGSGAVPWSFSAEEVAEVLALIGHVDGSALAEVEGMPAVLSRLASQLQRLEGRMQVSELEALEEPPAA